MSTTAATVESSTASAAHSTMETAPTHSTMKAPTNWSAVESAPYRTVKTATNHLPMKTAAHRCSAESAIKTMGSRENWAACESWVKTAGTYAAVKTRAAVETASHKSAVTTSYKPSVEPAVKTASSYKTTPGSVNKTAMREKAAMWEKAAIKPARRRKEKCRRNKPCKPRLINRIRVTSDINNRRAGVATSISGRRCLGRRHFLGSLRRLRGDYRRLRGLIAQFTAALQHRRNHCGRDPLVAQLDDLIRRRLKWPGRVIDERQNN